MPLAADKKLCTAYFVEEFHEEYGPEFHAALKRLTENFLSKIESHLPITVLEKVCISRNIIMYTVSIVQL